MRKKRAGFEGDRARRRRVKTLRGSGFRESAEERARKRNTPQQTGQALSYEPNRRRLRI